MYIYTYTYIYIYIYILYIPTAREGCRNPIYLQYDGGPASFVPGLLALICHIRQYMWSLNRARHFFVNPLQCTISKREMFKLFRERMLWDIVSPQDLQLSTLETRIIPAWLHSSDPRVGKKTRGLVGPVLSAVQGRKPDWADWGMGSGVLGATFGNDGILVVFPLETFTVPSRFAAEGPCSL